MKPLDRFIQRARIAQVRAYVGKGSRVLDIGCADGALFEQLGDRIVQGVGIDPDLSSPIERGVYRLIPGEFPDDMPQTEPFDAITMLAVLEHIPEDVLPRFVKRCASLLRPMGKLIITVPSPAVDRILHLLLRLRVIDGMDLHQHHEFDVTRTPALFSSEGLVLARATRFQLGLNNLFVFQLVTPADTGDANVAS